MSEVLLSEIISRNSGGKNCYGEKIELDLLLKSICEKLENMKAFCNGSIIHEIINVQTIISIQLKKQETEK